jgi:hypothetical protein
VLEFTPDRELVAGFKLSINTGEDYSSVYHSIAVCCEGNAVFLTDTATRSLALIDNNGICLAWYCRLGQHRGLDSHAYHFENPTRIMMYEEFVRSIYVIDVTGSEGAESRTVKISHWIDVNTHRLAFAEVFAHTAYCKDITVDRRTGNVVLACEQDSTQELRILAPTGSGLLTISHSKPQGLHGYSCMTITIRHWGFMSEVVCICTITMTDDCQ